MTIILPKKTNHMFRKTELREKAIVMRKKGVTYNGIMDKVPVAKSTLNLWFRSVKLSRRQKQTISLKRRQAQMKGALAKHKKRIIRAAKIIDEAEKQVGNITPRELWLIGTTLYWAEGAKEKDWHPGTRAAFINMDPFMIKVFLRWLKMCDIKREDMHFDIYLHENHKHRVKEVIEYWSKVTKFPESAFVRIYYKKNKINTRRRNVSGSYFGILRIYIKQSSTFLRKITGWIQGINNGINRL